MEVEEGEEVEDEESAAAESRLARNVANFGMALGRYYTPGRMNSEGLTLLRTPPRQFLIQMLRRSASYGFHFPVICYLQIQTTFQY
jgi:hypothetical protein